MFSKRLATSITACDSASGPLEIFHARIDGHRVVVKQVVKGYLCLVSRDGYSANLPDLLMTNVLTREDDDVLEVERELVVEINQWAASKGFPTEDLSERRGRRRAEGKKVANG